MRAADNFSGRKVKEKINSPESRKRLQQREEYLESRQCKEADNKLYHNRQGHLEKQLPDYSANQKNQPGSLTCLFCSSIQGHRVADNKSTIIAWLHSCLPSLILQIGAVRSER